jgi:hypothetical protein
MSAVTSLDDGRVDELAKLFHESYFNHFYEETGIESMRRGWEDFDPIHQQSVRVALAKTLAKAIEILVMDGLTAE